ncbi:hypothetical protein BT96DRAFT_716264 [Gymnopus androsaceus JB14]|uniref:Uncharacterized protein n=1 Tax=Gymnopus androsaceus JB14 TaxID=1447944 RepID=A0A6A4HM35_9AGAR|nr:hypothetical protein BT96DRAFT_716264 [Gymnopus androsaceus JB14]
MSNPNTIVIFGPSPDSYYVGHGRLHFVENMSPSFTNHAKTALNISFSRWISVSKTADTWIDYNIATDKFHFNADINQNIQDHFTGANGKVAANFISFPDSEDSSCYFVKGKRKGGWNAVLPDYFIQQLSKMQREVLNFDAGITGMLFGKGKTSICLFETGFQANFDEEEITSEDHPLYKVLLEFSQPNRGWCIEPGSTLCFYDSRFFYLKFKKPGESIIQMRSNLPTHIAAKLEELRELAQKPEEQMALMQQDNGWNQLVMMRINNQMNATSMMVDIMNRGSLNILAAASGGHVVERRY